jgi:sigma54-dependent transcription regulator
LELRVNLDVRCRRATHSNLNMAVPWVLMSAYLYYHRDDNILTDGAYDDLTKRLRAGWGDVTHRHKALLDGLMTQASSSLFDLKLEDYPSICRSAASSLAGIPFR